MGSDRRQFRHDLLAHRVPPQNDESQGSEPSSCCRSPSKDSSHGQSGQGYTDQQQEGVYRSSVTELQSISEAEEHRAKESTYRLPVAEDDSG